MSVVGRGRLRRASDVGRRRRRHRHRHIIRDHKIVTIVIVIVDVDVAGRRGKKAPLKLSNNTKSKHTPNS